ncbi:type II toxin-antitoxin system death-on-curing family toxin [Siphonobacter sp. BAB-5405]|uniref:type II toxin-antitoxin system death-on-curing family toxin n=1 Tax=Siphonobacter sp. BAB-5405 TaxID=1864825 RepID=UPI000C8034AC|nr:type II toxin-antitoxin system death-on-curing family toxin [Siphonobacter sp. BAB-5405]PMD94548.1 type II toxin-antitoxin system death-on-curing family toxin [Siphonobacter sp. BAB-5405]
MIKLLSLRQLIIIHEKLISQSGGGSGIRDEAGLKSAVAQPEMTFGGQELYPGLAEKAAALCFSLTMNHPFVDGNKRIGHAALEITLKINGYELSASVDEQEQVILDLASGLLDRETFTRWVLAKLVPFQEF